MNNRIIITGAPGTGKTTLINLLDENRFITKSEVARKVLDENLLLNNTILPWSNRKAFDSMVLLHMLNDYFEIPKQELTFYDGGLPDILAYEMFFGLTNIEFDTVIPNFKYNNTVFIIEPWESIYIQNEIRPWKFEEVEQIHRCILEVYETLGYETFILKSKTTPKERMDMIFEKRHD